MLTVNYLEIAKQQKFITGECAIQDLPRLQSALLELGVSEHAILGVTPEYQLQGLPQRHFGDEVLPMLRLQIKVNLPLVCQRCFGDMPSNYDLTYDFAICTNPPPALEESEEVDWLAPENAASVAQLVEDELLMGMPIAVMHETACVSLQQSAGEKPNPFAVLEQLKVRKDGVI